MGRFSPVPYLCNSLGHLSQSPVTCRNGRQQVPSVVQLSTKPRLPRRGRIKVISMKRIIPLFALALLTLTAPLWAETYTASSCSASDVQSAINSATDGDTVLVPNTDCPSGSPVTWSSAVTVTKGIYLKAQGSYISFGSGSRLSVTSDSAHGALIQGFNFSSSGSSCDVSLTISSSTAPMRFTGNTWTDKSSSSVTLMCINGLGTLLVDHNTLTTYGGAAEVIHILGLGAGNANWTDSLTPGSPKMVYLESNTFNNDSGVSGTGSNAEEAYYGAEFVFRYNTLNNEANDVHGGDGGRWYEIYENTYTFVTTGGQACYPYGTQLRGGSGLFYSNHVSGARGCGDPYPTTTFGPDCPSSDTCSGTWPVPKQVGRGINKTTYSPAYAWGNDAHLPISAMAGSGLVYVGAATTDSA